MKKKYDNGNFSDSDWEELAAILSGEKSDLKGLVDRLDTDDKENTGKLWKELATMDNEKEINVDNAWNRVSSRITEEVSHTESSTARIFLLRRTFMKVAATVIILVSLGITAALLNKSEVFSHRITFATGNDQKNLLVSLSDGSRIYLNRNSELTYRGSFGKRGRNVKLTGEAFFEIAPDAAKPFIIDAGKAKVRVVGTSFNVITSNGDSAVEVYVKTGKVLVSGTSGQEELLLDPGYVGTVGTAVAGKKVNENPNYLSWNTGLLVYNGQKLDVVFRDLKRVYNMDIIADDPSILDNLWTSPIDNQPQDTIIRLICASFNLSYTKDGNVYHLAKK